jgi:hypothetical protein
MSGTFTGPHRTRAELEALDTGAQKLPTEVDGIARRARMDHWTEAEHAIQDAIDAVERVGADVRLTDAVVLLGAARDSVADFAEGVADVRRLTSTRPWF